MQAHNSRLESDHDRACGSLREHGLIQDARASARYPGEDRKRRAGSGQRRRDANRCGLSTTVSQIKSGLRCIALIYDDISEIQSARGHGNRFRPRYTRSLQSKNAGTAGTIIRDRDRSCTISRAARRELQIEEALSAGGDQNSEPAVQTSVRGNAEIARIRSRRSRDR